MNIQSFFDNNIQSLVQISITERKDKGFGAIFIDYNEETKKVDCRYLPIHSEHFPEQLREQFSHFNENNKKSIIYFVYTKIVEEDKLGLEIIQMDLESDSKSR
jgi:hypothetical protein